MYEVVSSLFSRFNPSSAVVTSSSALWLPKLNALAAFASTADPSPLLVLDRCSSEPSLPEPAIASPSLAVRLGMNRSPASSRTVVLPDLVRSGPLFRLALFDGVWPNVVPVPVNVQSDTPSSRCLGDLLALAMFDLGEFWQVALDVDLEKYDVRLPYVDCDTMRLFSAICRGGVNGDELLEALVARLVVRLRGDGVRGIRPPAVRVEKIP